MNDRDLHRLLDDAANAFEPTPSHGRLALALGAPRTPGRRLYVVLGIAAGLTALGAGAAAMTGAESAIRSPADQGFQVDERDVRPIETTAPTTTEPARPQIVVADLDRGPIRDRQTAAEPEPVELLDVTFVPLAPEPEHDAAPPEEAPAAEPVPKPEPRPEPVQAAPTTTEPHHEPPPTTAPHHEPPPTTRPTPTTTEPPHEDPPPTTAPATEFSARQFWGSCSSDPPYDEFEGHAAPGSVITVSSPHGSASTTAGADGSWYVQVFVPNAPIGESFRFVAESSSGGSATFSFVRTG